MLDGKRNPVPHPARAAGRIVAGLGIGLAALAGIAALLGCTRPGLAGENGVLVLAAASGAPPPFGIATGGTVAASLVEPSFTPAHDASQFRVEVDDASILVATGSGANVSLTGVREGSAILRVFEGSTLVDQFRVAVGTPTGVGLALVPDPSAPTVYLHVIEAAPGFLAGNLVMSDARGRPVLDDAAVLTIDGTTLPASGLVSAWLPSPDERHVLTARVGDVLLEDSLVVTDGAVDAIARVGTSHDVVRPPRGGRAACFVGMRDGHAVLNAPITVTATSPQSVTTRPTIGLTCVTPSGPGVLRLTAVGREGEIVLDVTVTP